MTGRPVRRLSSADWVLVAAIVFAVAASLAVGLSAVPLATADETGHLDYAYELWHGHLPVFENGVQIAPPFGAIPPVQWEAQHPPLFYAILAPVVGPLIDAHHYYAAVIAGRTINALVAGLAVFASRWAARRVLPNRPRAAALAAISVAMTPMLFLLGGAIYNDLVCLVLAALALGLMATALRLGMSTRLLVAMSVVGAAGMLSRIAFAVWFLGILAAILLAPGGTTRPKRWGRTILDIVIVGASAAVAAGWFYVRNLQRLTGNLQGSHPAWGLANMHRQTYSTLRVLERWQFWSGIFSLYKGHLNNSAWIGWVVFIVPLILAVVFWLRDRHQIALVLLMTAIVVATTLIAVNYVADAGGANTRYSVPLLPIYAVAFGFGVSRLRWLGGLIMLGWLGGAYIAFVSTTNLVNIQFSEGALIATRICFGLATLCVVFFAVVVVGGWSRKAKTWGPWDADAPAIPEPTATAAGGVG